MPTNTVAEQQLQQPLTENIIKKVALRFLRQYYKFRLRYEDQPVTASYDLEGVGGVIADGYYSFKKTDGRLFTATFEATGKDSINEVLYKPQMRILFWDGVAVASLITLVLSVANYHYDLHLLDERTVLMRTGLVLTSMVFVMAMYYFIAKNFRRYRYIYAVEQFKRYHADEQWIALAEDVFPHTNDKYFQELKFQCIYNGVGIVQIDQQLDTKILVTPSRQDIFLGKRKKMNFLPQKTASQTKAIKQFDAKWALTRSWLPAFLKGDNEMLRFRRKFYIQMAIALGCFLLVGFIFLKEMQLSGYQFVERDEFRNDIAKSQSNGVPEQPEIVTDTLLDDNYTNPDIEEFNNSIWKPKKRISTQPAEVKHAPRSAKPTSSPVRKDTTEIMVNLDGRKSQAYDCSRYYTFQTHKYVVVEGNYKNWPAAERRLALIRNKNIPSAALSKHCFFPNQSGFFIYLGEIFNSPEEASQYIDTLSNSTQNTVKNVQNLEIKTLRPPVGR